MEETNQLNKEEVFDVLKFAEALYGMGNQNIFQRIGYYNSDLANQTLKDLNNDSQIPTSYKAIENALKQYKNHDELLRNYSNFMYYYDSIYKSTLDYYCGLLSFDLSKYCINAYNPEKDYSSKEYKDDLNRVYKFFNKFNYKKEFRKVLANMLKSDVCFVWLRDSEGTYNDEAITLDNEDGYSVKKAQKFALQIMPQSTEYCKITGEFPDGFLWDFNLNYFNMSNVSIDNYDPSLRKALNEKKQNGEMKSFILENKDLNKTNSYINDNGWIRTKVKNGAWCFKFDDSNVVTTPPFSPLMKIVFNDDVIQNLQLDKDIASAYALLVGEIKTIKDQQAKQKDPFTINPTTLGTLLKLVQSGLKKNIKPISLPLEETKLMQFIDNSPKMAINQYKTSASNGASASSLIYSDDKMGQFELQSAIINDYNCIAKVYFQFENFLNFFVNRKTKKYKFRFKLEGCTQPFERENRINNLFKLLDKGLTPNLSTISSTFGYGMQEFQSSLEEAHYSGLAELTTMLQNANTTKFENGIEVSNKKEGEGRPSKDVQDLTESGENTRNYG